MIQFKLENMKKTTLEWVLKCVDTREKYFNYSKGQYVNYLLKTALKGGELSKKELLNSSFGFLLNKPQIKDLTKNTGSGRLKSETLNFTDGRDKYFGVSLGKWGESKNHRNDSYYQTSCPGENLVLQLNFDLEHDILYHNAFNVKKDGHNFTNSYHPISKKANTMAWSRIDLDFETGEALIEEIQNDWLREVLDVHKRFKEQKKKNTDGSKYEHWIVDYVKEYDFEKYVDYVKSYNSYWSEAMLMATIDFIVNDLGIKRVYYHTYESGNYFKGLLEWSRPPRSLYTKLPKSFGFRETQEAPEFWKQNSFMKKRMKKYEGNLFFFDYS